MFNETGRKRYFSIKEGRKIFKSNSEGRQQKKFENPCTNCSTNLLPFIAIQYLQSVSPI